MIPVPQAAIDLIRQFEGCRLKAYQDQSGVWTQGWGHTGHDITVSKEISQSQADLWLHEDAQRACNSVQHLVVVPLTQNQLAALTSFAFNLGIGAFGGSTMLKILNAGGYDLVPEQLCRWAHVGQKEVEGLKRRREAEANLWKIA